MKKVLANFLVAALIISVLLGQGCKNEPEIKESDDDYVLKLFYAPSFHTASIINLKSTEEYKILVIIPFDWIRAFHDSSYKEEYSVFKVSEKDYRKFYSEMGNIDLFELEPDEIVCVDGMSIYSEIFNRKGLENQLHYMDYFSNHKFISLYKSSFRLIYRVGAYELYPTVFDDIIGYFSFEIKPVKTNIDKDYIRIYYSDMDEYFNEKSKENNTDRNKIMLYDYSEESIKEKIKSGDLTDMIEDYDKVFWNINDTTFMKTEFFTDDLDWSVVVLWELFDHILFRHENDTLKPEFGLGYKNIFFSKFSGHRVGTPVPVPDSLISIDEHLDFNFMDSLARSSEEKRE